MTNHHYDAVIIGSGFGGAMIAKKLVDAGWKIAIVERGKSVERGSHNWARNGSIDLTEHYDKSQPYFVEKGGNKPKMGVYSALGGPSIFYGGVSFRFREQDFAPPKEIIGNSHAQWPISYNDLSTYYDEAETILQISGEAGVDPSEPRRNIAFPQGNQPLSDISLRIKKAAQFLNLNPFRLPLAINYENEDRPTCQKCTTCDTFACAIGAKNDIDTMVLANLQNCAAFYTNTLVTNLNQKDGKISSISCKNVRSNEPLTISSDYFILSAGALGSPHLILNSQLDKFNPSGQLIGRYLMRHANAIVFGIFPTPPDKQKIFHKELAIMDYYFGIPHSTNSLAKLGSLQSISTPPPGLVEMEAPRPLGKLAAMGVKLLTGLLAIAEDQPCYNNKIYVDFSKKSKFGMHVPIISSEYSARDKIAINELSQRAKVILHRAGAWTQYVHHIKTFSHSVGTIRMGINKSTSPLDMNCKFRGIQNLFVVDGSFMPTSAAVNPSLTISANALRIGDHIINHINPKINVV